MAKIVNSAKRALDVLELFVARRNGLSVKEISDLIGAPLTSCVDIVHTLCAMQYLSTTAGHKKYLPTGKYKKY